MHEPRFFLRPDEQDLDGVAPHTATDDLPNRLAASGLIEGLGARVQRRRVGAPDAKRLKLRMIAVVGCACEACRIAMPIPALIHLHHIVPVAAGGETRAENAALLCPNCHAKVHWIYRVLLPEERPRDRVGLFTLLTRVVSPTAERGPR